MQDYQTDPRTIYAIVGNFALMKCDIPSFLADFVTIHSWTDGTGNEYFRDVENKFGNDIKCELFKHYSKQSSSHKEFAQTL